MISYHNIMSSFAPVVDWGLIVSALDHYEARGYDQTNAAWAVPYSAINETISPEMSDKIIDYESGSEACLVGSAEQSLVWMFRQGLLPLGRYVAATPCFRREPTINAEHQRCFFKVELIKFSMRSDNRSRAKLRDHLVDDMIPAAVAFFEKNGASPKVVATGLNGHTFDIIVNGVEVGSYGLRDARNLSFSWVYGTGLAEPRFTYALGLDSD